MSPLPKYLRIDSLKRTKNELLEEIGTMNTDRNRTLCSSIQKEGAVSEIGLDNDPEGEPNDFLRDDIRVSAPMHIIRSLDLVRFYLLFAHINLSICKKIRYDQPALAPLVILRYDYYEE